MAHDTPFVGRVFLEVGQASGSPQTYDRACEIDGISGLGETNALVDVTTFCSNGNKEYIGGLSDGQEMTLEGNFLVNSDVRDRIIQAVKAKSNLPFRVVVDDDHDGITDLTFWFTGVALSWKFDPSVEGKNKITFGIKISGAVDITKP
jgi:hypothetical protein